MSGKWSEFQPSKSLWFWSCAGCVVATMVVGFTLGGWVSGGTASKMASAARDDGRVQLAADVCVARFKGNDGFAAQLASLKKEDSWKQDDFVAAGGWVTLAGMDGPVAGSAKLCAEMLTKMDAPTASLTTTKTRG